MNRAAALALLLCATTVAADEDAVKRPRPDYDGRGDAPTTVGDALIWIPRVATAPLYLVSEYVVRRPMEVLVVTAERNRWPERVNDYLNGPIGIVPTGAIDLGAPSTIGFYFWWNDVGAPGNQVRAAGSIGSSIATASLLDRVDLGGGWQLAARGALSRRSEVQFYGIGYAVRFDDAERSRYKDDRIEGSLSLAYRLARLSRIRVEAGMREVDYRDASCCGDPSIPEAVGAGLYPLPPGYAQGGFRGPFSRVSLVLDSRDEAPATGVALDLEGEEGSDTHNDLVWVRAAATLSGSVELGKRRRVASLSLHAALAEPLQGDDIPFTELATLGGTGPLPGFLPGRLLGRSAVAATLKYEWPVWAFLTGVVEAGVGNVFDQRFDGFTPGRLRFSTGMGVRSVGFGDARFELLLALGTKTFDDSAKIDSVRFSIGTVVGF